MKKISNMSQLVRSIIKGRRKSYVFLITAIFFAVLFSSFSMLITYGAITSIQDIVYQRYGYQDYILNNANDLPVDDLVDIQMFSEYGTSETLGYVLPDGENFVNGFSIAKYDEEAFSLTNKQLIEGSLPKEKGEIAIESTMLDRIDFDGEVGDEITLTLAVPDGTGFLENRYEKTYILTGILHDQYIYQMRWRDVNPVYSDIPAAIVSEQEEIEAGGIYISTCYYVKGKNFSTQQMFNINYDESSVFQGIYDNVLISNHDFGLGTQEPSLYNLLVNAIVFAILSAALLFAAGFGIASAFSANANERKRQIGMLRAVGATKRQIRSLLTREILFLSIISIPAGILFACLAVNKASGLIGDAFVFKLNVPVILLVILFSLLCIIISALIPIAKASKIPPMQAIRSIELSRKMKRQKMKGKWKYDAGRHIACRTIKLYKNRLAPINIFIFFTVAMLIIGAGIGPYTLNDVFTNSFSKDFTITISEGYSPDKIVQYSYSAPGISESDRQDAQNIIGDGIIYGDRRVKVNLQLDEYSDYITDCIGMGSNEYLNPESSGHESYLIKKDYFNIEKDFITVECIGVDDEIVENLASAVYAGEINIDKISSGEEIILIVPQQYGIIHKENGSTSMHQNLIEGLEYDRIYENDVFAVGDEIDITLLYTAEADDSSIESYLETSLNNVGRIDNTVKIGALIEMDATVYFPFFPYFIGTIITTQSGFEAMGYKANYSSFIMKLNYIPGETDRAIMQTELTDIAAKTSNAQFVSYIETFENDKRVAKNILYLIITLLILFFSMSVIMINNSISARIRSGRQLIGTMRAVGSTRRDVRKMFVWQLVYMIAVGTIAGVLLSLGLYLWVSKIDQILAKEINILLAALSLTGYSAVLFALCYFNIFRKTESYLKHSIITNIREL